MTQILRLNKDNSEDDQMAYRFEKSEPLRDAFRRISIEQIDKAIRYLSGSGDQHANIHEARKAFKRIRSLLFIARPAIGDETFRKENKRFRDIARSLSAARDNDVMLQTLTLLQSLDDENKFKPVFDIARKNLEQRIRKSSKSRDATKEARAKLEAARIQFEAMPVGKITISQIVEGVTSTYRDCRKSMKKAYKDRDPEHFHSWRKPLQRHWRHVKLLSTAWPQKAAARIEAARQLSDILGTHNDIDVLQQFIRREFSKNKSINVKPFLDFCEEHKKFYQGKARPMGQRLFDEPAEHFANRFKVYWKTATSTDEPENRPL